MTRRSLLRLVPVLVCLSAIGCGNNLSQISGKVSFKGQPIKAGKIYFIPDGSKGNSGPTGYAEIVNGSYNTASEGGKGASKGAVIVAIEGIDPDAENKPEKGDTSGEVTKKTLFPRYETTFDVTDGSMTKDFDVPAEAIKQKAQGKIPVIP